MSIDQYNGSGKNNIIIDAHLMISSILGLVAMCGKNCVAIASDSRFGIQQQTVTTDMKKVSGICYFISWFYNNL